MSNTDDQMKPCPFCGSEIVHVKSLAKSFDPPRLYHEWHHADQDPQCQIFRFGGQIVAFASDDPGMQEQAMQRWNRRSYL
jgi:hypothetical protein